MAEATTTRDLRFAEEILLLMLKDDTGYVVPIPEWRMACALSGAALMDLSLEGRIDTDAETLVVLDAAPTGDELLDPSLAEIAAEREVHAPLYWVERIAQRADDMTEAAFGRLVARGILDHDTGGFFSVSSRVARSGRYPLVDGSHGEEIRGRILRTLFGEELPDPRDVAIIALVDHCGGFEAMLEPEAFAAVEERIGLYSGMDVIGRAIAEAVRTSYVPPGSMRAIRRRPLPRIALLDFARSPALRAGNIPRFFAEQYRRLGPAFRLKGVGRDRIVLAGPEVNRWMQRKGRLHLRSQDYLQDFQAEWGTGRSIASLDGADHYRLRRAVRAGNARTVVQDRLAELLGLCRASFREWGVGRVLPGETTCQRLIGAQIAQLSTSISPSTAIFDELLSFEYRALLVHVLGVLPGFMLRTPRMKRYKAKVLELYAHIHATHTPGQREGRRRDLVDDLMALHRADPQFLPETDLGFAFIAPIIAGHYTGSATAFAVYELLANPDAMRLVAAEADALFAGGDPAAEDLDMDAIDATHRVVMETLRLHPVVPVQPRTAANGFEIGGMEIPAGSDLLVSFASTHYLEEHFGDAAAFDIDRFLPPREEHRQAHVYAPFGLGTHTCLGSRWTELQLVANLLAMVHHLELEMVPADYRLRTNPLPKLSPDRRFRFRVRRIRHPVD